MPLYIAKNIKRIGTILLHNTLIEDHERKRQVISLQQIPTQILQAPDSPIENEHDLSIFILAKETSRAKTPGCL